MLVATLCGLQRLPDGRDGWGEWLTFTPAGVFDGSPEGLELVAWREGGAVQRNAGLMEQFHRPELVAKALSVAGGGGEEETAEPAAEARARPE